MNQQDRVTLDLFRERLTRLEQGLRLLAERAAARDREFAELRAHLAAPPAPEAAR